MNTKKCHSCGAENLLRAKKCYNCGKDITTIGLIKWVIMCAIGIFIYFLLTK